MTTKEIDITISDDSDSYYETIPENIIGEGRLESWLDKWMRTDWLTFCKDDYTQSMELSASEDFSVNISVSDSENSLGLLYNKKYDVSKVL